MFNKEIKEKRDIINSDTDLENNQPDVTLKEGEQPSTAPKKPHKKSWIVAVTTVLVVVIVLITAFNLPIFRGDNYLAPLPTKITQEEAYKIYKDIYHIRKEHEDHSTYEHNHSKGFSCISGAEAPTPKGREDGIGKYKIVKNYGKYIYIVNNYEQKTLNITQADKGKLTNVATIDIKSTPNFSRYESTTIEGIFLYKNILAVLLNAGDHGNDEHPQYEYTVVKMFDVSNPYSPKYITEYAQMGMGYYKSFLIENILYVFTDDSPIGRYGSYINGTVKIDYRLPSIAERSGDFVPIKDLYVVDTEVGEDYLSVISIDLNSQKLIDSMAVVGGSFVYINEDSVYVTSAIQRYNDPENSNSPKSSVLKFKFDEGKFIPKAKTTLDGQVATINEYNGSLRVVASIGKCITEDCCNYIDDVEFVSNSVYILDKNLKTINSITGLGKLSLQFLDDLGYFEIWSRKNTDEYLNNDFQGGKIEYFMMDFSNVKNLQKTSSVRLPKGTDRFYYWGDDKLLSIPEARDKNGDAIIKLTMLDVSDMTDIKEIFSETLSDEGTTLELYTILEEDIIGFANGSKYIIYSFDDDKGFIKKDGDFSVPVDKESIQSEAYFARLTSGIFIDNYLYVCNCYGINSYNLSDSSKVDSLTFKKIS